MKFCALKDGKKGIQWSDVTSVLDNPYLRRAGMSWGGGYRWHLAFKATNVLTNETLYPCGKGPFRYENSVWVKNPVLGHMSWDHIASEDCGVVRVGVLPPLALRHRLPVVVEDVLGGPDLHGFKIDTFHKDELNLSLFGIFHPSLFTLT
jgi:hypothetical protein